MCGRGAVGRAVRRVCGLACAAAALAPALLPGGVIRHDRDDAQYLALADLPDYQSVGQVRSAVGGSNRVCSGTLIAPNWVLTAAHCLTNTTTESVFYRNFGQSLDAERIIVHPQFTGSASTGFDIGLIELAEPSALIAPAQRMRDTVPLGRTVTMVGYGATGTGSTGSITGTHGTKRAGQNTVDRSGTQVLDEFERPYPEFMLFADFDNPDSPADSRWGSATPLDLEYQTAGGDSGGGWFLNYEGRERLYAVHSVGVAFDGLQDNDYGDAAGATRVTRFNSWIDEQLGDTYWVNPAGGAYDDPENWSSAAAPAAAASVRFAFPLSYGVHLTGQHQADRWTQDAGVVDFQLTDGDLQLGAWRIAAGATGKLAISANHQAVVQGGLSGDGLAVVYGGGALELAGAVNFPGQLDIQEGGLRLADGAVANVGGMNWGTIGATEVSIGPRAALQSSAQLYAGPQVSVALATNSTLHAPSLTQEGALALAGGQVVLDGPLEQTASASTSIDLAPLLLEGAATPLTVGAAATLGGALRLSLPRDFTLLEQQTMTLLTSTGPIQGTFASVEWTYLPLGLDYALTYERNRVLLTLDGPGGAWRLDGDTNRDLVVDLSDLNNVLNNFGEAGGIGDVNGDQRIDLADLNAVRNNLGAVRRGTFSMVPEPSTAWLGMLGAIAFAASIRKRR